MSEFRVRLILERETKGALLYKEVDKGDIPTPQSYAKLGNLYVRKNSFPDNKFPKHITVVVSGDE
jgi:hypothetical protein